METHLCAQHSFCSDFHNQLLVPTHYSSDETIRRFAQRAQYIYQDSKLLSTVVCFAELV